MKCTKTIAKVNSDHLAESSSVTKHSLSDREVALAGGLGLHAHDGATVDINSSSQSNTHTGTW